MYFHYLQTPGQNQNSIVKELTLHGQITSAHYEEKVERWQVLVLHPSQRKSHLLNH